MPIVKVPLKRIGSAWRVILPTFTMLPGGVESDKSYVHKDGVLPEVNEHVPGIICAVEVPAEIVDERSGRVDVKKLRQFYKGTFWENVDPEDIFGLGVDTEFLRKLAEQERR